MSFAMPDRRACHRGHQTPAKSRQADFAVWLVMAETASAGEFEPARFDHVLGRWPYAKFKTAKTRERERLES